jgi:SIR2-like protein
VNVGQKPFELLSNAQFEIGGEDQLTELRSRYSGQPVDEESNRRLETDWQRLLADTQIRTGTLLKTDTVSLLLGAGTSTECGGPLIGTIPLDLERELLGTHIPGEAKQAREIPSWIECFYLAVRRAGRDATGVPLTGDEILRRRDALSGGEPQPLRVNLERLLSLLHRWRSALPKAGGRLRLDGTPLVDLRADVIDECIRQVTSTLARLCRLPASGANESGFDAYKDLLRKVLTRPLNLKRANIFTLNYDTLVEQAADAEGIVLIDGFVGTVRRVFRPESYDHDLYFPAETTEGRVHRLDRVLHLYKLHGSITWTSEEPSWNNPYGIRARGEELPDGRPVLIYPTPAKWGEALGMPYAELLRRFAMAVVRPQSVLFILGYGFGDEHICAIVRQALAIPSFTLVIVDPKPQSDFVAKLREQGDRRVWILSGDTFGKFTGFARRALADLRDESVRRKVMETHRALDKVKPADREGDANNA